MTVPALATLEDLEARMGAQADEARALAVLDDASALIRAEAGDEDWLNDDDELEDVPPLIVMICCKVAQRTLGNPGGVSMESLGSFSQQYTNASPDVYLTRAERRLIRRATNSQTIGSIGLTSEHQVNTDIYVPVYGGGEDIPMGPWPESTA